MKAIKTSDFNIYVCLLFILIWCVREFYLKKRTCKNILGILGSEEEGECQVIIRRYTWKLAVVVVWTGSQKRWGISGVFRFRPLKCACSSTQWTDLCLILLLELNFVCARSWGSGDAIHLRSFAWTHTGRTHIKYHFFACFREKCLKIFTSQCLNLDIFFFFFFYIEGRNFVDVVVVRIFQI